MTHKATVATLLVCAFLLDPSRSMCAERVADKPAPPARPGTVALVLDCSGSMAGKRAQAMKEGAKLAAAILDSQCELLVIDFHTIARSSKFPLRTPEQRVVAMKHIEQLKIGGGTDYLAALQAAKLAPGTPIVFLSDGEHNGDPGPVLDYIRVQRLGPLHTIAVEAPPEAARLLADMAARTGGSMVAVQQSEALVQAFLEIAQHIGEYRVYKPDQDAVPFAAVRGKLIAFGFDAAPAIVNAKPALTEAITRHQALLPGEQVSMAAVQLPASTALTVKAGLKRTPQGRLAILRNDLARAQLTLSTPGGIAPTGGTIEATITFTDRNGKPIDPRTAKGLTAEVQVIDGQSGKTVSQVPTKPSATAPALEATIRLPAKPGPVSIRSTTVDASAGPSFTARQERLIQVQTPLRLSAVPSPLKLTAKEGAFTTTVKLAFAGGEKLPATFTARLDGKPENLRLLASKSAADGVHLQFAAAAAGTYRGTLVIDTTAAAAIEPLRLPYELTIQDRLLGLNLPEERTLSLGSVLANTGAKTIPFDIPSRDSDEAQYTLEVEDLASGSAVIAMKVDAATVTPTKAKAARVTLTATVGNVPAGDYRGTAALKLAAGNGRQWRTTLTLTVTEPLSAKAVNLGKVEVGKVVKSAVVLHNAGGACPKVTIAKPTITAKGGDIIVTLPDQIDSVPAQAHKEIPLEVAVSPLVESRGLHKGVITIRRTANQAITVPIEMTLVDVGKGTGGLLVAPTALQLTAKPGEVVEFSVRIKFSREAAGGAADITAAVGTFAGRAGQRPAIEVAFQYPDGAKLKQDSAVTAKGFLVAPDQRGTYTATLTVASPQAAHKTVPVTLEVR